MYYHINSVSSDDLTPPAHKDATKREMFADVIFNSLLADTILSPQRQEILTAGDGVEPAKLPSLDRPAKQVDHVCKCRE